MKNIKTDLHVHINGRANKKEFIEFLKKAERDGVKKLCLLEHDKLTNVDIIQDLLQNNELHKYFTGDLIVGAEYNALINTSFINEDGSCYDGYTGHYLVYMSLDDAKKMKQNARLYLRNLDVDYQQDYEELIKNIKKASEKNGVQVEIPAIDELKSFHKPHIVKDLYFWMISNSNRQETYSEAQNLTDEQKRSESAFIRQLAQKPSGILFYVPQALPSLTELISIIRATAPSAKMIVAHPAYMHNDFNTKYYLDGLMSLVDGNGNRCFDGIEGLYFLNTVEEETFLKQYAESKNLIVTGGTDSYGYEGLVAQFSDSDGSYYFKLNYGKTFKKAEELGAVKRSCEGGKKIVDYIDESSAIMLPENLFSDLAVNSVPNNENIEIMEKQLIIACLYFWGGI